MADRWWVFRIDKTYAVYGDDDKPGRGVELGSWSARKVDALDRARTAAQRHANRAGGKKEQWKVEQKGDAFEVVKERK